MTDFAQALSEFQRALDDFAYEVKSQAECTGGSPKSVAAARQRLTAIHERVAGDASRLNEAAQKILKMREDQFSQLTVNPILEAAIDRAAVGER